MRASKGSLARCLLLAGKGAISAFLVWYLLDKVGVGAAAERVRAMTPATIIAVLVVLLLYTALAGLRWFIILRTLGVELTLGTATRISFVGSLFNQFLPASIGGDIVRVWQSFVGGLSLARTVNSVLLERTIYLLVLSAMAAGGAQLWSHDRLPHELLEALWLIVVIVAIALAIGASTDRLPQALLPPGLRGIAIGFARDARTLLASSIPTGTLILLGMASQGLLSLAVLAIAEGFGIRVGAGAAFLLLPAVILVSSVPISLAGWGAREYAMVTALGFAGIPASSALLVSIALGVFSAIAGLAGAVAWILPRGAAKVR